MTDQDKIAICGIGGAFPGAKDLAAFWGNIEQRIDASRVVPTGRWPVGTADSVISASAGLGADQALHTKGYYLDELASLDFSRLHIDPSLVAQLDPLFHLTLQVASDAFFDSVWQKIDRKRTGIIAGNILLPTGGSSRLSREYLGATFAESCLALPSEPPSADPRQQFPAALPIGIAAQALGLGGGSYALDAACASTLYALHFASLRLLSGEADAMIAGGICRPDSLYTQIGFSHLGALSPSGHCRPFTTGADGLLVGEGGGMFLLKRLSDAVAHGDRIYGVIAGIGLANDMQGGLVAPDSEGQLRALHAAYSNAGLKPQDVQYIECHATGTPLGDRVEIESLGALWNSVQPSTRCVLGGVKGNVGHLLTASGAASLIKVLLALKHKTLPPTLHAGEPLPLLDGTPFDLLSESREWPAPAGGAPRRAAINGFGFGGINAHVVIEEYIPATTYAAVPIAPTRPLAIVGLARAAAGDEPDNRPLDNHRWYGAEKSRWFAAMNRGEAPIQVRALEKIDVPIGRYRIAPRDLAKMSPQQLLFLEVAHQALHDAGFADEKKVGGGVFVGVGLDAQASHFTCRWQLATPQTSAQSGDDSSAGRQMRLKDAIWPPLDAERTLGNLGAMTASRVAREFRFGGMGLTFSNDENSGVAALEAASRAINAGDITMALVGAVDFASSLGHAVSRTRIQRAEDNAGSIPYCYSDGAMAFVVMDAEQALAEGRNVYATIENISLIRDASGQASVPNPALCFGAASALMAVGERIMTWSATPSDSTEVIKQGALNGSLAEISLRRGTRLFAKDLSNEGTDKRVTWQKIDVGATAFVMAPNDRPTELPATLKVSTVRVGATARAKSPYTGEGAGERLLRQALAAFSRTQEQTVAAHEAYCASALIAMNQLHELARGELLMQGVSLRSEQRVAVLPRGTAVPKVIPAPCAPAPKMPGPVRSKSSTKSRVIPTDEVAPGKIEPVPTQFDYAQCLEFARGSIGRVMGRQFAAIDSYPTRVRLPDEPLLLCHRILDVQGEPLSLSCGKIITEHDVLASAFYLDDGLIPIGIVVEAGQADLFLSAYLGIDFKTKGEAKYRLLDAIVTFHSCLPRVGDTIRYDISIEKFFAQGDTRLFRFGFEATVRGKPLLTMKHGVAGFFTDRQLAEGRGVIAGLKEPMRGSGRQVDFDELVPMARESYDGAALDRLRAGDYEGCFGEAFSGLAIDPSSSKRLPDGMMRLVHRIAELDPVGGRYGIGRIVGEADIHPDDWFLACHFVDDMVMPGTLMYECCFQTLRVFLMRLGWVGDRMELACEPIAGAASALRCRGQVLVTTKVVTYEIHIKEFGYNPDAYAMADALMYADGKLIVEITNMTLTHPGFTAAKAKGLWQSRTSSGRQSPADDTEVGKAPVLLNAEQIRAFAGGKPSLAFGEAYAKFDDGSHFVARLPMDPYLFMDRVVCAENMVPMVMKEGGIIEVSYDVRGDEWFFGAEKSSFAPYCVINEIALQACGFLAAYMGSALTVKQPLYFRNLAGAGRLRRPLDRNEGRVTTKARCVSIVKARELILQRYDFQLVGRDDEEIYRGQTEFGFFSSESLAAQIGIRKRSFDQHAMDERVVDNGVLTHKAMATSPLLMVDEIVVFDPTGGRLGLGYIKGRKRIDTDEWFFKAHFLQDPVMPGSLGLEGFVQLLKVCALKRFALPDNAAVRLTMASGAQHSWLYRGQVLPSVKIVEMEMQVQEVDDPRRRITASGMLWADGLCIYQVKDFTIMVVEE